MKIKNLKTNGLKEPLGYDYPYITLSWQVIGATKAIDKPLTMNVEISKSSHFDEILINSKTTTINNQITLDCQWLQPRTRYYWRVSLQNVMAVSFFETAKMDEKWQAHWISYSGEAVDSVAFTHQFNLAKPIKNARIYLTGFGLYELYLNQKKVADEELQPGYQSYDLTNYYQTFDCTGLLQRTNDIRILTGNGWYKGRFVFDGGQSNIYGSRQQAIAELHIEYTDGSAEVIGTDSSWQASSTVIQKNSIYDGEILDFAAPIKSLPVVECNDTTELLHARLDVPVGKIHKLKPQKVFRDKNDQLILDFGQEITGWVEGTIPQNTKNVRLRFGELLQDGVFNTENLRTAKQEFAVYNNFQDRKIRPHFTYYGFRFVEVAGVTEQIARDFYAYTLQSKMDETLTFDSSNPLLNQLVSNIQWSQRDNSLSIPTDCPQRDERMGWTGDVTIFCNSACYNADTKAFYTNYLNNLALEQKELNGSVPFFVPYPKIKPHAGINPFLISNGAATWGDVATILPITLWHHYHDQGLLNWTLPIMQGWVDYLHKRDVAHGDHHLWDFDSQLGDWLALDNEKSPGPIGATDPNLIASVYYYRSVTNLVEALKALSKPVSEYADLASEIRQAIITTYFSDDVFTATPVTQTAASLMIRYHLYPNSHAGFLLGKQLQTLLNKNHDALNTGFIGTPELLHALVESNNTDLAYKLLFRQQTPSWLFEVDHGATTVWERWNSLLPNGKLSGTEMNSLNHYAYGSVEDFIIEKMLGINSQVDDGHYSILPAYTDQLEWVTGKLATANGSLSVSWSKAKSANWQVNVTVPSRCSAMVKTPEGVTVELKAGVYEITHDQTKCIS